eukprot:7378419-Prymnesium_polylepis.1
MGCGYAANKVSSDPPTAARTVREGVANVSQHAHYSSLITLHSSLFTLHSSPFEREHPYETLQPAPWRHQDPPNVHRGVNAHFQCREYAGNRHVHGTLITLHSSLFTLHSSLFEFSGRRGGVS